VFAFEPVCESSKGKYWLVTVRSLANTQIRALKEVQSLLMLKLAGFQVIVICVFYVSLYCELF
jgi:hypothetical protein